MTTKCYIENEDRETIVVKYRHTKHQTAAARRGEITRQLHELQYRYPNARAWHVDIVEDTPWS